MGMAFSKKNNKNIFQSQTAYTQLRKML